MNNSLICKSDRDKIAGLVASGMDQINSGIHYKVIKGLIKNRYRTSTDKSDSRFFYNQPIGDILRMYRSGLSVNEIANKFKISKHCIYSRFCRAKIKIKNRRENQV